MMSEDGVRCGKQMKGVYVGDDRWEQIDEREGQ